MRKMKEIKEEKLSRLTITNSPANNPEVRGSASIAQGQVAGVAFTSAKADIFYADSMVLAENIAVDALGGHISGEARFSADTYDVFAK